MARTRWVDADGEVEYEDWHAPRGRRWKPAPGRASGEFMEDLARSSASMGAVQRRALDNFVDLVEQLDAARATRGLPQRALARETGVALSTLRAIDTGSVWGRYRTWCRLAKGVGLQLSFYGAADGLAEMRRLLLDINLPGESIYRSVAFDTQLRVATIRDLHRTESPSMETLLAVAASLDERWSLCPLCPLRPGVPEQP